MDGKAHVRLFDFRSEPACRAEDLYEAFPEATRHLNLFICRERRVKGSGRDALPPEVLGERLRGLYRPAEDDAAPALMPAGKIKDGAELFALPERRLDGESDVRQGK